MHFKRSSVRNLTTTQVHPARVLALKLTAVTYTPFFYVRPVLTGFVWLERTLESWLTGEYVAPDNRSHYVEMTRTFG